MANKRDKFNLNKLPQPSRKVLVAAILLSLLAHLLSYVNLDYFGALRRSKQSETAKERITVRVIPKEPPKPPEQPDDDSKKSILEARQEETEAPENARFKGAQDHKTDRETKVRIDPNAGRGLDPGQGGRDEKTQAEAPASSAPETQVAPDKGLEILQDPSSKVIVGERRPKERMPRNTYESLMPNSQDLKNELQAGYQDYIDEEIEVGERIDINTTNFRYIGYFTTLRKAFELVWTYPSEAARRGMQGEVRVEFTIVKDGTVERVRVVESSGHRILDDAVIEALLLASPYAPLPEGFKKEELTVVGSFRYVLSNFAGAY